MNPDLGTELRSGRVISSSSETPVQTDPDMAQSSANDSDSNEVSDISSQLSEIKESYERKINELQNEFSQLKDLMMAVISKTDTENRQSTSKGPSKPTHTVGLDSWRFQICQSPMLAVRLIRLVFHRITILTLTFSSCALVNSDGFLLSCVLAFLLFCLVIYSTKFSKSPRPFLVQIITSPHVKF